MIARTELLGMKKLIGLRLPMSFRNNKTGELWRNFMHVYKEIKNKVSSDLYSLQVFGPDTDFARLDSDTAFEKWALSEVMNFDTVPEGMEKFILPPGLYAVFNYTGAASEAESFFREIFGNWIPASGYVTDNRPHFEILGARYKNGDPESEEEIWIPIRPCQ
jgi:AraC family transcriptional regulator